MEAYHHCHTDRCPVGIATQDAELEKRMNPKTGTKRVACYLSAMTIEKTTLAKPCRKSSVLNLEVRDPWTLSFQVTAFTGARMAGIERAFEG